MIDTEYYSTRTVRIVAIDMEKGNLRKWIEGALKNVQPLAEKKLGEVESIKVYRTKKTGTIIIIFDPCPEKIIYVVAVKKYSNQLKKKKER
jgi:hypothetical protein